MFYSQVISVRKATTPRFNRKSTIAILLISSFLSICVTNRQFCKKEFLIVLQYPCIECTFKEKLNSFSLKHVECLIFFILKYMLLLIKLNALYHCWYLSTLWFSSSTIDFSPNREGSINKCLLFPIN